MRHSVRFVVVLAVLVVLTSPVMAAKVLQTGSAVPGEIVVKIRDRASANDIAALERAVDADKSKRLAKVNSGTLWRMHSRSKSAEAVAEALQHNPNVEFAEPNFVVRLVATPNDPSYSQLWGLKNNGQNGGVAGADIDAESAWNLTKGSASIVVGVVDTGIDYTHPDLAANMWSNPGGKGNAACAAGTFGFNAISGTCDPKDDHDHGTHVAGTIGAVGDNGVGVVGVNWTVKLMALKFLSASGSGTTADAIEAIDFAVQAKIDGVNVRVLSNSWGGGPFSKALLDIINKASEHDILFVAAAGNDSSSNDLTAKYPASYATPNMIAVAATDRRDALAYFSNYGATSVHLGAPGMDVLSTVPNGGYSYFNGTSMATPHVSGVAALVLAKTPSLTTAEVKDAILESVDPIPSLAGRTITGGRLNAAKAVGAPASPDFGITVAPASRTVLRGNSTSYTISIIPANGFNGSVALSVISVPFGTTATFNPSSTSTTSTLTLTTSNSSPLLNNYSLTITGTSGAMTRSAFAGLSIVSAPPLGTCPSFATSVYTSANYSAVATADFNRDGKADAALAELNANRVAVRLGSGGSFLSPVTYAVGKTPLSIVAADFNGDGKADLATANAVSHNVSILIGNGDGTFQTAAHFAASTSPFSVTAGDFNRDGKSDLAVANNGASNVSILIGNGDGTFAAAAQYAAGSGPFWVTVTDADRDGKPDLAVANFNDDNISLLRGNGDGTFQAPLNTAAGQSPSSVTAGDFNRDGVPDLAVANYGSNNVSILAGNGNGTFAAAVHFAVGTNPYSVAAGDLTADGKLDLVVANSGSATVSILIGSGNGSFVSPKNLEIESPQQAAIADLNGDGKPDVVVAAQSTYSGQGLAIIRNNSDCATNCGTLAPAAFYSAGTTPESIARGDFNGDGRLDLVAVNRQSNNVSVKFGNGDGTFAAGLTLSAGTAPHGVAVGDFNRDGRADLAVGSSGSSQVAILLGNGDGTFQSAVLYAAGNTPRAVAVGDFNRDGKPDLAVAARAANGVTILIGSGTGTFAAPVSYSAGTSPESVAVGDFNRDGVSDLVVANSGSANVSLLLGNANGTFQSATNFAAGTTPYAIVAEDLDGDSRTDIAVANAGSNNVSVLLANGSATFQAAAHYAVGSVPYGLAAADLNDDGRLDLITANSGTNNISVLPGADGAIYGLALDSGAGTGAAAVVAGDFDRDGKPDLGVANSGAATVAVLRNTCPTPDLTVTKTHSGTFTQGQSGKTYTITVTNVGGIATNGTVTVVDDLPTGLGASALSGTGWTCTTSPVLCTRSDALAAGASYPAITLTVKVAGSAPASVTNTVTVSGGGELNTLNNVATDPTTIAPATDLVITKTHSGSFAQGATGRVYTIRVRNIGGLATSGTVTVTDTLPAGLTATALSGSGWTCTLGSLTCTRSNSLAGSSNYPPITLTVNVAGNAPAQVTNTATLTGGGDANTSNNTASDPTVIWASQTCGSFSSPSFFNVGWYAANVAVADFNHDGEQDLAAATLYQNTIAILLGNGDGTFEPPADYSVTYEPRELVAADMDSDGNLDLVVAASYASAGSVSILRGLGDGTFAPETRYAAGASSYSLNAIAVGDVDNDGNPDVAATSDYTTSVYVFAGNGDGTLQPSTSFGTISQATAVAIADLDGNSTADLAVAVSNGISVLLGNGNGTFGNAVKYTTYESTGSVVLGDFNGDGIPDLAASSYYVGVLVFLGRGDGTFRDAVAYDADYGTSSVTASDVNADGKLDLLASNSNYGSVSLFLGRGDGTFQTPSEHAAISSAVQVAVSDFNGDGKADLVVPSAWGDVSILLSGCADLNIVKSHIGNFRGGQTDAIYSITVRNVGTGSTTGPITVKDVLPAGLTATGFPNSWPWTCELATLTCTSPVTIAPDQSWTLTLQVSVSTAAPSSVINTATVSGGGDTNTANNSASDPTTIVQAPDLTINKSHVGAFTPGQNGVYTITVGNVGTGPTSGTVTVVDLLPSGMTGVSMTGTGWSCDLLALTCTRSDVLGITQSYPSITLTVALSGALGTTAVNWATVSGGGEVVTSNNSAQDLTQIITAPFVNASAISATQISVTWSDVPAATTYEVWRSSNQNNWVRIGTPITPLFLDTTVVANTGYRYKIRALQGAVIGPFSQPDLATTFFFTDDPLAATSTRIKALHLQELRTAVNIVRASAGLPAATFSDAIAPGGTIKASHLLELRNAINEARAAFGQSPGAFTFSLGVGLPIRGLHVTELRNTVK